MVVNAWLKAASQKLEEAGIQTARLDALILLEDVFCQPRAWLLAHPEAKISPARLAKLNKLLNRRARHEPLAYLRGKAEFYGREFIISPDVLQPRPESETMIDLLKDLVSSQHLAGQKLFIADVGAGSGALGITAALEQPGAQVELLEIDPKALKVAKSNVDKFTLTITVIKSDLLNGSKNNNQILLCNLPYVPDGFQINLAAGHEPPIAIFGGPDGLDLYRKLFKQVTALKNRPLYILTEALPPQQVDLADMGGQAGYKLQKSQDFIQLFELQK